MESTLESFEYDQKLTFIKLQWKISNESLVLLLDGAVGDIRSSEYKLKFLNSTWSLSLDYGTPQVTTKRYRRYASEKDLNLKLHLYKADINESLIYVRSLKVTLKTFPLVIERVLTTLASDPVETNLKQRAINLAKFDYDYDIKEEIYDEHADLIIECEVKIRAIVNVMPIGSTCDSIPPNNEENINSLSSESLSQPNEPKNNFNVHLLQTGIFSDCTFTIGTKTIKAHRVILAAQSEYFQTMFESELKESNDHEITITDVEPEIFEALLLFLYTKETPQNIDTISRDLLIAADKYLIGDLVEMCEEKLCKTINPENCVELLAFTGLYNCKKLKEKVVMFIKPRMREILKTESWKQLMKEYTELALEVFESAI